MARKNSKYNHTLPNLSGKEKAVIYVRVSSQSQVKNGNGLDSQERLCREWANYNNIEVVKIFSDGGVSGKYSSREALSQMIEFLGKENSKFTTIQYVVVDDIDRISRDIGGWLEIKFAIMGKGARIHSLKQQMEESPEGVLNQNIVMSFKQYERENNARRVSERMRARLLDGYRPRYQPPGYESAPGKKGGRVMILSEDAKIIKEGLELYAKGEIIGHTNLQKFFVNKGVKSKQGNKIHLSWIQRLIERDRLLLYCGYIIYPEWGINQLIEAKHDPIIDLDTMNRILAKENPKQYYIKSSETQIGEQLPLRGLLFDSESGNVFSGGPSQGKKKLYYYYSCRVKTEGKTKTINLRNSELHEEFVDYLGKFKIDDSVFDLFDVIMREIRNNKQGLQDKVNQDKKVRIKEIVTEIDKNMERISKTSNEGMIVMYENKIISLQEEMQEIKLQINNVDHSKNIDIDTLISNTKAILRNPAMIWELGHTALQKMLISIIFGGKIFYNKKTGFQTPEIPLIYHVLTGIEVQNNNLVEMMGVEPMSK